MRTLRVSNAPRRALQTLYQSRVPAVGAYLPEMRCGNDLTEGAPRGILGLPQLSVGR